MNQPVVAAPAASAASPGLSSGRAAPANPRSEQQPRPPRYWPLGQLIVTRLREFYRPRDTLTTAAPVQLNEMVEQAISLTRARWNDLGQQRGVMIQAKTELAPDLPSILGVESIIREKLTNLIFNAVNAMPDGGTLTVRTRSTATRSDSAATGTATRVQVEVVDTGIGMDEETKRRCLEPFFTTKGERGTGLGLAMVYGAVQRHGGELEIESLPGQGAIVRRGAPCPCPVPRSDTRRATCHRSARGRAPEEVALPGDRCPDVTPNRYR